MPLCSGDFLKLAGFGHLDTGAMPTAAANLATIPLTKLAAFRDNLCLCHTFNNDHFLFTPIGKEMNQLVARLHVFKTHSSSRRQSLLQRVSLLGKYKLF
jgi:hypothetical protein